MSKRKKSGTESIHEQKNTIMHLLLSFHLAQTLNTFL